MAALRGAGEGLDAELVSFWLEEEHWESKTQALSRDHLGSNLQTWSWPRKVEKVQFHFEMC